MMSLQNKIGWAALGIVISLLGLWLAIPAVKGWRAERLVDRLCANDGGIRVYETIELPRNWDPDKLPLVRPKERREGNDELYYAYSSSDIQGQRNSTDIGALVVFRTQTELRRGSDDKLLALAVSYVRRGGDPIGPWHPSSYQCPPRSATTHDLIRSVLKRR